MNFPGNRLNIIILTRSTMNFPGNRLNIIILTIATLFWNGATEEISVSTNTSHSGDHHHHDDYPLNYDDYQDTDYPSADDYGNGRGRSLMDHDNEDYSDSSDEEHFLQQLQSTIPGVPGVDYPLYQSLPDTSFSCQSQRNPGFYGDVEAQCQVFHICQEDDRHDSFLCPLGTVFNQMNFVCDWWFNFKCSDTPNFYHLNSQVSEMSGTTPASMQVRKAMKNMRRFRKASRNMAAMMKIVDDMQNSGMDKRHQQNMAEKMMRAIMKKRVKNLFTPRRRSEKIWMRTNEIQNDETRENNNASTTTASLTFNSNELKLGATTPMHDYLKLEPMHEHLKLEPMHDYLKMEPMLESNVTESVTIPIDAKTHNSNQDNGLEIIANVTNSIIQYQNPVTNIVESEVEYSTNNTGEVNTENMESIEANISGTHLDDMNMIVTEELATPTLFSDITPVSALSPNIINDGSYNDSHGLLVATFMPPSPIMDKSGSIEVRTEISNITSTTDETHNDVNQTDTEEIRRPRVVFSFNSSTHHEPLLSIVNDTHISVSVTIRATAGLSRLKWKRVPDSRKMRKYFDVPIQNEDNLAAMDLSFRKRNMKPKSRIMWIPVKNNTIKMRNYWGMYTRPPSHEEHTFAKITPTEKIEMLSLLRAEFLKSDNDLSNNTNIMSPEVSTPMHTTEDDSLLNKIENGTSSVVLETSESSIKNTTEYLIYNISLISESPVQDINTLKKEEISTKSAREKTSCKSGCSKIMKILYPKQNFTSMKPVDHLIENIVPSRRSQTVFGRRSFLGASPSEQLTVKYDPRFDCEEDQENSKESFRGWSVIIDAGLVTKEKTVKRRKCRDDITPTRTIGVKTMPKSNTSPASKTSKKNQNKGSQHQSLTFGSADQQYWLNLVRNWLEASPNKQQSYNINQYRKSNDNSHADASEDWSKKLVMTDRHNGEHNGPYNSQEIYTRGRASKAQDDSFHNKWSSQNTVNQRHNTQSQSDDGASSYSDRKKQNYHSDDLQSYQSGRNEWLIDVSNDENDFKTPSDFTLNNAASNVKQNSEIQIKPVQNSDWRFDNKDRSNLPSGELDRSSRTESRSRNYDTSENKINKPSKGRSSPDARNRSTFINNDSTRMSSSRDKNWSTENGPEERYWASSNQNFQTVGNNMEGWQTAPHNSRNDWSRSRRDMNTGSDYKKPNAIRPPTYQLNEEILAALTADNFMEPGSWGNQDPESPVQQGDGQLWLNDESDWSQDENMMEETWPTRTMNDWSTDSRSSQPQSNLKDRTSDWPATSKINKGSWSDSSRDKMTDKGRTSGRNSRANDWPVNMQTDISNDDSGTNVQMRNFDWSTNSRGNGNKKGDSRNQSQWPQQTIVESPDWSMSSNGNKYPAQSSADKGKSRAPIPPVSKNKGRRLDFPNQESWNDDSNFDMISAMAADWSQSNKGSSRKSSGNGWSVDASTVRPSWAKGRADSRSGRKVDGNIDLSWDSDETWDQDSKPSSVPKAWDSAPDMNSGNDWAFDQKPKSDWSSDRGPTINNKDDNVYSSLSPPNKRKTKGSSFPNPSIKGSRTPDKDWSLDEQKSEDDDLWSNDKPLRGQMKGSSKPNNKNPDRDWSSNTQKSEDDPWANDRPIRGQMKGSSKPRNKSPDRDWSSNTQKSEDDPWANDSPMRGQNSSKNGNKPVKGSAIPKRMPDRDWSDETQKSEDDPWANDRPMKGQNSPKNGNKPMKGSAIPRRMPDRDWSDETQKSEDDPWANDKPMKGQNSPKNGNKPMKGSAIPKIMPDRDWSDETQKSEDDPWANDKPMKGSAIPRRMPDRDWSDETQKSDEDPWANDNPTDRQMPPNWSNRPIKGSSTSKNKSPDRGKSLDDEDWSSDKSFGVSWSDKEPDSWAQDKPKAPMTISKGSPNTKRRTKTKTTNGNGKPAPSVPWSGGVKGKNSSTSVKGEPGKMDEEIVWSIQIGSNGKPGNGWVPITLRPNLQSMGNDSSSTKNRKGSSGNGSGQMEKPSDSWDKDDALKVTQSPHLLNADVATEDLLPSAEVTEASQVQRFYISDIHRRFRRENKNDLRNRRGIGRVREIPKSTEHEYEEMKDENNRFFLASADILVGDDYTSKNDFKEPLLRNNLNKSRTPKNHFLTSLEDTSSSEINRSGKPIDKNVPKSFLDLMQESKIKEIWSEPFDASSIPKSGWIPMLSAPKFKVNATNKADTNGSLNNPKFTSFNNDNYNSYDDNFKNQESMPNESNKESSAEPNSDIADYDFTNVTLSDTLEGEETADFFDEEMKVGNETIRVIPFSNVMKQIEADAKEQSKDNASKDEKLQYSNSEWNLPMTTQPKTYSLKQIDASEMLTGHKSGAWMFAKQSGKTDEAWILVEEKKQPTRIVSQDMTDNNTKASNNNSSYHPNSRPAVRKQDYVYKVIVGNRTDERINLKRMDEGISEKINIFPTSNHTDKFSFNFQNVQLESDWTPLLRSVGSVSSRTKASSVNRRKK